MEEKAERGQNIGKLEEQVSGASVSVDDKPKEKSGWKDVLKLVGTGLLAFEVLFCALPAVDIFLNRGYDPRKHLKIEAKKGIEQDLNDWLANEFSNYGIPPKYINGLDIYLTDKSLRGYFEKITGSHYPGGFIEIICIKNSHPQIISSVVVHEIGHEVYLNLSQKRKKEFFNALVKYRKDFNFKSKENKQLLELIGELRRKNKLTKEEKKKFDPFKKLTKNEILMLPFSSEDSQTIMRNDPNECFANIFEARYAILYPLRSKTKYEEGIKFFESYFDVLFKRGEFSPSEYNFNIRIPKTRNYPFLLWKYYKSIFSFPSSYFKERNDGRTMRKLIGNEK